MKKLIVLFTILLFASMQIQAQDVGDMKAKFNDMNKKFAKMMLDNDYDGILSFYADDIISLPSYQPMVRGLDAIKKSQEMEKNSGNKMTAFDLTTTDVINAGDYYIEIGTYTLTMDIPGMQMPYNDKGKYMNVWEKQDDGSLKMKVDTWNSDINPWQMMQGEKHEGDHHDNDNDHGKPEKMETHKK